MKPAFYGGVSPTPVVPVMRPPLPPFDPDSVDSETGAPLPVYTTLRESPPPGSDVSWWRGDAWGLTLPGLPHVPGGAGGPAEDRVLTYFLDRYGRSWEDSILRLHQDYGYTHISLSPQDSWAAGQSEDDYVRMSVRCRKAGLNVHHLMRSKYYTPAAAQTAERNPDLNLLRDRPRRRRLDIDHPDPDDVKNAETRMPDLSARDQLLERLLSEGCCQIETPAWECNHWSPEVVRQMITHDSDLIGTRCRIMLHFFPHYISWQLPSESPTDFWKQNYGRIDGVCWQCDPYWTAGMMAARANDCLDRLAPGGVWGLSDSGRGHPIEFVPWEVIATCQYNNDHDGDGRLANEDIGSLKGYELLCAPGKMVARGYGGGGRQVSGAPL